MNKLKTNKAFTIVELIVVIAIIAILVLLGTPKIQGYVDKAKLVRIQHDVRAMEQEIGIMFINKDDDINKWENNSKDFNQLIQEGKLFEKEGYVKPGGFNIDETYKVIPEKYKDNINTKLKGTFYANSDGKVYYEHEKSLSGIPTESEKKPVYSDDEIADLINEGFIPIATDGELNQLRHNTVQAFGKGTKWEGQYTSGLDKKYIQVANIDLGVIDNFEPIGTDDNEFTGTYDGGGYTISNLKIDIGSNDDAGLFGIIDGSAELKNIGLVNADISGESNVGGLVGFQYGGSITNSYASGSVSGAGHVGGLVGFQYGGSITNSYASGSVSGGDLVGGLVGFQYSGGIITNSYASGSVSGEAFIGGLVGQQSGGTITNSYASGSVNGIGGYVGGLVGYQQNDSIITNSYASGSVSGESYFGGLVGQQSGGTITNSYASGSVSGTGDFVGGLVGQQSGGTIINSYWDKQTTGQTTSDGTGATGKTTAEMKAQETFSDWDFDTIWQIKSGEYPTLQ